MGKDELPLCTERARVIFALDIGTYKTGATGQVLATGTTAAWCRLGSGVTDLAALRHTGTPDLGHFEADLDQGGHFACTCGRNMEKLPDAIVVDLQSDRLVALGFEAPMWLPLNQAESSRFTLFEPRFAKERGSEWYLQSGAAATLKAIALGVMLRSRLEITRSKINGTTVAALWEPGTLLLFEAFVAGPFKVNENCAAARDAPNEWDALTAALAWGGLHVQFETPPTVTPVSLHAAGARRGSCLSVWDVIWSPGTKTSTPSGPPDCEVVALQRTVTAAAP